MKNIIINGLSWDKLSGCTVNNARFYLKSRRLLPPAGCSYERLAFFICALEPLLELFFASQHFEGEYSIWVQRTLAALPRKQELKVPDADGVKIFNETVADEPKIGSFLRGLVPDIPMDGYVALAPYRAERTRLKTKEKVPFANQRGKALTDALKTHSLAFKPGSELPLWIEFLTIQNRLGEDLREAFIEGRYHLNFSNQQFKDFIYAIQTCPGLNAHLLGLIYEAVAMQSSLFSNDTDARRIADIFAGPLLPYAQDYASHPKDIDLISLFSLEDPARMKELAKSIAGDLQSGWKDFFYIADYGNVEARDFEGFDQKLDQSVAFIRSQYRQADTIPDLWEDQYFKFLYLMSALWFKHCCNS